MGHGQPRYGHRQFETARAGAAGIDIEHVIACFDTRLVGVSRNHDLNACGARIDSQIIQDVKYMDTYPPEYQIGGMGNGVCPARTIIVAAHHGERREGR